MTCDVDDEERARVRHEFADAVTLAPTRLEEWLGTEESRSVGRSNRGHDPRQDS